MQKPSTFQVYNASAGSGKTFTLVKEYLKILLQSEDIFRFQKVLAITFTNKASSEMKERVLKNLHEFSEGKNNDLLSIILKETLLDKEIIEERSTKILSAILQNYSAFSITTIDSFTHKIIKNFAYDLGLTLNFEVEMDAVSLLNEAVDVLISKIGTDKELTKLLINFSLSKTDDDKSWDISRELGEFSKILLNENDTKHFRKLANKSLNDFTELKNKLQKNQKIVDEQLKEIGKKSLQIITDTELEFKDFTRQTFPNFLKDLSTFNSKFDYIKRSETIEKAIANHAFYNKTVSDTVKNSIESILPQLIELFNESKLIFGKKCLNELALKSIIPLAVLNNINSELTVIKEDNNIRLNAEFNQLISDNIKDQPAPFIYERIGQRFMHYFIDEMQDTSVLQWQNLIPLIGNALAQENSNLLLVGDGKQAIYRWRGGKAEQFINLSSSDKSSKNPFYVDKQLKNLGTNFRSYSEIINFNNQFFQHTANFLQNESYKKLFLDGNNQKVNTKKGGFVSISFLEKEKEKEDEKLKYPKKVLEKINELKSDFSLNEICVLVRKKKDGIAVANYLSENGINIISSETLLLQNSPKVNFLVNMLRIIQHPKDEETHFEFLYFLHEHLQVAEDKHSFLNRFAKLPNKAIFEQLKTYGADFNLEEYHQLPFYEKVEAIIRSFKILTSSDAYVQFFLDVVLEKQRKGTNVQEFLDFWVEKKDKLSIVTPESSDAVQVMTIHKSKGLEFPVVIFPCDLNIYQQINPKVWLNNLPKNYDDFKELLVDFNAKIKYVNNIGLNMYQQVQEELELDNFNLLYVALTRPVEQLHIITEYKTSSEGKENTDYYSGIFINYLKNITVWNGKQLEYCFGSSKRISKKEVSSSSIEIQEQFISTPWQEHNIKLLASSSNLWDTKRGKAIDFGNLIHEMLSKIYTKEDIKSVINQYEKQNKFSSEEKEKIKTYIYGVVEHPKLKNYFKKNITVYNERELVSETGVSIIPDRLIFSDSVTIIDYKTGKVNKKHQEQLIEYENLLRLMNFSVEKKILVYINEEILIKNV